MAFFQGQLSVWLRSAAALVGTALITGSPAPALGVNLQESPSRSSDVASAPHVMSQNFPRRVCSQDLQTRIDSILNRPQFATARWGIAIEALSDGIPLYTHRAENMLIPASNIKLLTTAAALRIIAERSPRSLPNYRTQFDVINRHSNNYHADELLRTIGGQTAVNRALEPLGVNSTDYWQVDGSGLSRSNKAKPSSFVTLLKAMYETDTSGMFYDSLPIGGINGTLRNRFKATPVQGRVHAKTGTLRGVRALSGYLETLYYGTVAFSIVINQPGQSGSRMLQAIDDMVLQINQVQPCR